MATHQFSGLEWLSTATVALTASLRILSVNPATESLFQHSQRHLVGMRLTDLIAHGTSLLTAIDHALANHTSYTEQELELNLTHGQRLVVNCTVNVIDNAEVALLIEFRQIDQQIKAARDERMQAQVQANRELIRNLAHEIKNPLGGVRGAAQLLARELSQPHLTEYTQVIISETDRLQNLLNRMLAPNRPPVRTEVNIHEVLHQTVTLIDAEFNVGSAPSITLDKDFDVSLPPLHADREQLMQAVLNVVRNAAQILTQHKVLDATIKLSTRIARGVTIARHRHRLAIAISIEDNGPGIPADMQDKIFHPLVSGRDGGTGLGLTIAQTFVTQHDGMIEVDSMPGATRFRLTLPLP
jgi:two-component system, NtrC family, nitrogen regulation sensor histidine kinase GlnL